MSEESAVNPAYTQPAFAENWSACDGVIEVRAGWDPVTETMPDQRFAWEQGINVGAFGDLSGASPFNAEGVDEERAICGRAAPEMVRTLLAIEWGGRRDRKREIQRCCPACGVWKRHKHDRVVQYQKHEAGCSLDAALTRAGLPPAVRDAAREYLATMARLWKLLVLGAPPPLADYDRVVADGSWPPITTWSREDVAMYWRLRNAKRGEWVEIFGTKEGR